MLEMSVAVFPYEEVKPYSTCVSAASLVVHVIVADESEMFIAETPVITGAVPPPEAFTVTIPGVPVTDTALPSAVDPVIPVMPTVSDPAGVPGAIRSFTTATVPAPIEVWFRPKMISRTPLGSAALETSLPAELDAEPAVVETHAREEGNTRSNWSELTGVVPGVRLMGTSTLVPGSPDAAPTLSDGVWAAAEAGRISRAASTPAAARFR